MGWVLLKNRSDDLVIRKILWIILILLILFFPTLSVNATQSDANKLEEEYSFSEIDSKIGSLFQNDSISVKDMVLGIMSGDLQSKIEFVKDITIHKIKNEVNGYRSIVVSVLLLGIISALFAEFSKIFKNHQISDISYYLVYLLLVTILIQIFSYAVSVTKEVIENIVAFMKLLIPTFYLSVGMASGELTALSFYKLTLCIIFGVESLLVAFLLPLVYSYVFLAILNGMMEEERLAKMLDIIKKGTEYLLNASLTVITGFGILQSMITPVIDTVKSSVLQKVVSAIPGIGGVVDTATEVVYGSAVLIKNSIGIVLILLLIVICVAPLCKLMLIAFILKGCAAIIGIVSDKRITGCIDRVGDGGFLLFRTALTSIALFFITIAIVAVSTNRGF